MNNKQIKMLIEIYQKYKQSGQKDLTVKFSKETYEDLKVLQACAAIRITGTKPVISLRLLVTGSEMARRYINQGWNEFE